MLAGHKKLLTDRAVDSSGKQALSRLNFVLVKTGGRAVGKSKING
jgi:hypothetical protein